MMDIRAALRELAEPWPPGSPVKSAIDRAARRAGLAYWRTFDLWYGKARRVEPDEIDAIADAIETKRRKAVRDELHDLHARIRVLEARFAAGDSDFYRPQLDGLRESYGDRRTLDDRSGRLDSPAGAKA